MIDQWNKTTKERIQAETLLDGYTLKVPKWEAYEEFFDDLDAWAVNEDKKLQAEKDTALKMLSERSREARSAILDDQTILNVLSGATAGYPDYLTPANMAGMIEQFKSIAKTAKSKINNAANKEEIDAVLDAVKFPTAAEILKSIQEAS